MSNELSSEELLRRYQAADADAFREFFDRHRSMVFGYLVTRLRDRADAEEAFQQTFFRVHRYVLSYDPNRSAVSWLMAIARHAAADSRAGSAPGEVLEAEDDLLIAEPCGEVSLDANAILSRLSPEDRNLLERRYYQEDPLEDRLRKRLSRLLRRLRTELAPA